MRSAIADSRDLRLLSAYSSVVFTNGTPIMSTALAGTAPNNTQARRATMITPAPQNWSWGAYPGYTPPILPAGTLVRVRWRVRRTADTTHSISPHIARGDGTQVTWLSPSIVFETTWTEWVSNWTALAFDTTANHLIRFGMPLVEGAWIEFAQPVLEIRKP